MKALLRAAWVAAFLAAFAIASPSFAEGRPGQREIEEALTCQCGCGLTVAACNHLQCGFAIPARERIAKGLAEGQTAEQILEGFKNEYGEKVLSSPIAEGFNVLAWIAPYLTIAVAGTLMFAFFRRKAARTVPSPSGVTADRVVEGRSDERLERLRRDLEDLDR
jgi:cytochrome c-type biogenesis protein CcmH